MKISTRPVTFIKILFSFILFTGIVFQAKGQLSSCDPNVPYHYIDLSGNPDSSWISPNHVRAGNCCGTGSPDRCTSFEILLDTQAVAISFDIYSGAVPPGSMFYQINCGPQIPVGETVCISGVGPHRITFCKPGNNENEYILKSIPKPIFPEDDTIRKGCSKYISVLGLDDDSLITWNSIAPGSSGDYNSYLSCTNCSDPLLTPGPNAPNYVDYQICGWPEADECGYNFIVCDTVRIYFIDSLNINASPNPASFCNTGAGSGVTLTAKGTGGDGNYSYNWRDSSGVVIGTGATYFASTAGSYTAVVQDGLNSPMCPGASITIPVTVGEIPVVNAGNDTLVCATNPVAYLNGSINNAYGGMWSGGNGSFNPGPSYLYASYTPTFTEISNGSVDIILTSTSSGSGCPDVSDTLTIYYSDSISVSLSDTLLSCFGDSINISPVVSGGTSPYTYSWGNGESSNSIYSGVGNYSVTVTDSIGCTGSSSVNITTPPQLTLSMSSTSVSTNGGADGTATASPSGGTSPYSYSWSPSGQTSQTATGLSYGIHSVYVTDNNGCTVSSSVVVNEPRCDSFIVSTLNTDLMCFGDTNAWAAANPNGGTSPYSYSWDDSKGQLTDTAKNLSAGIYTVTVTDSNGCIQVANSTINQPSKLYNSMSQTNVTSIGGNDGSATANPFGGTPSYGYLWTTSPVQSTQKADSLSAGMYYVNISDVNNCSLTDSVMISQPPCNEITVNVVKDNIKCAGGKGSATVLIAHGTSPYTISWSNGQTGPTTTNLSSGTHTVTVTDAANCKTFRNFTIIEPTPLSLGLAPNHISCYGIKDGTIETSVSGGTLPYSFAWADSVFSEDRIGLVSGTYSLTVTDENGCTISSSVTINEPSPISYSYSVGHNTCYGDTTGNIDMNWSGGTQPYTFTWSNGATSEDLSNISAGYYAVGMTDANGCEVKENISIKVQQPDSLRLDSIIADCPVPGSGVANVTVFSSGGNTGQYRISFDKGLNYQNFGDYNAFLPIDSTYYVIVQDTAGCTLQGMDTLKIDPQTEIAGISFGKCFSAGTDSTTVTVTPSGGDSGPYQVSFDNGTTFESTGIYSKTLHVDSLYTVVVKDGKNCFSDTSNILIPAVLEASAIITSNFNGENISCNGATDGSAFVMVQGGNGGYSFSWSNGATKDSLINLGAGTYTVTVTDNFGCQDTASVVLTEPTPVSATAIITSDYNGQDISCFGETDGSGNITVNGGTPGYTYNWSNGTSQKILSNVGAGSYTVIVSDLNSCQDTSSILITQPDSLLITSIVNNLTCDGVDSGSIDVTVNGGTPGYSYNWSNSASSQDISGLSSGTYNLTVTDTNGCTSFHTAVVEIESSLEASVETKDALCYNAEDGYIKLTVGNGVKPYNYNWSNGENSKDIYGIGEGTYQVVITDSNNCTLTKTVTIKQPDSLTLELFSSKYENGHNVTNFQAEDGFIDLTVTGGTPGYNYYWSNGTTTEDLNNVPAGIYYITVTDANECVTADSIELTQPLSLALPTGFTPNNDGANDYFVVRGIEAYSDNQLFIFNRWGNEVYSKKNYDNSWNGNNMSGSPLPEGTYFVILQIKEKGITFNGYIDLRRN